MKMQPMLNDYTKFVCWKRTKYIKSADRIWIKTPPRWSIRTWKCSSQSGQNIYMTHQRDTLKIFPKGKLIVVKSSSISSGHVINVGTQNLANAKKITFIVTDKYKMMDLIRNVSVDDKTMALSVIKNFIYPTVSMRTRRVNLWPYRDPNSIFVGFYCYARQAPAFFVSPEGLQKGRWDWKSPSWHDQTEFRKNFRLETHTIFTFYWLCTEDTVNVFDDKRIY